MNKYEGKAKRHALNGKWKKASRSIARAMLESPISESLRLNALWDKILLKEIPDEWEPDGDREPEPDYAVDEQYACIGCGASVTEANAKEFVWLDKSELFDGIEYVCPACLKRNRHTIVRDVAKTEPEAEDTGPKWRVNSFSVNGLSIPLVFSSIHPADLIG